MLPQFTESDPIDINDEFGYKTITDETKWTIQYASDRNNLPEELAHLPTDYDDEREVADFVKPKTHTTPKSRMFMAQGSK